MFITSIHTSNLEAVAANGLVLFGLLYESLGFIMQKASEHARPFLDATGLNKIEM